MNSIEQRYRTRTATSAAIRARAARVMPGGDVDEPARALNGFLVLRLRGDQIVEEFRDENGNLRWQC